MNGTNALHMDNVWGLCQDRRLHHRSNCMPRLNVHRSMIHKLSQAAQLEGHTGCVNRIAWNDSGTLLVSGSDDMHIGVWEYPSGRRRELFHTQHTANIFGVRFLGSDAIVSGAMDHSVQLHLEPYDAARTTVYECHAGRVKDVEVEPGGAGHVWWSASEDGTVRQYDRRLPHAGCSASRGANPSSAGAAAAAAAGASKNVLVLVGAARSSAQRPRVPARAMGLAVSPTDPFALAVACGDNVVRVYDRRRLSLAAASHWSRPAFTPAVAVLAPAHAYGGGGGGSGGGGGARANLHATHVSFSPDGASLLATFHADHVYLFDVRSSCSGEVQPPVTAYAIPDPPTRIGTDAQQLSEAASPLSLPPRPAGPSAAAAAAAASAAGSSRASYSTLALHAARAAAASPPSGVDDPTDNIHRLSMAILRAHTLLAPPPPPPAWWQQHGSGGGGESGAPLLLSPDGLAGLYSSRAESLTQRAWRGDCYVALLDCVRARGLCPHSSEAALALVQALNRAGRRRACAAEARRFAAAFPECASVVSEFLPPAEQPPAHDSSSSGCGGSCGARRSSGDGSTYEPPGREEGGRGGGGGARVLIRVGGEGGAMLEARVAPRALRDAEDDSGADADDDAGGSSGSGGGAHEMEDPLLEEQEAAAAAWRRLLLQQQDGAEDYCLAKRVRYAAHGGAADRGSSSSGGGCGAKRHMFLERFVGARNVTTDIKEAAFFGANHVVAGSDDGRFFVWDRADGRLVTALAADEDVVNCVRAHPRDPVLATSGIESAVKLWAPVGGAHAYRADEAHGGGWEGGLASLSEVARDNQSVVELSPWSLMNRSLLRQIMVRRAAAAACAYSIANPDAKAASAVGSACAPPIFSWSRLC
ncbi:WD40-repeat-containing domain protein [Tribonema minus]|uniref:WD40-repeat-containing domain protein n=1 Tax=Tribonema minus TaxID=303371 RepID=A0A835ZFA4_9STRA|nr:WD40-repeat-containing domain protein [Tribonema minus]